MSTIQNYRICRECKLSPAAAIRNFKSLITKPGGAARIASLPSDHNLVHRFAKKNVILTPAEKKKIFRLAIGKGEFWGLDPVLKVSFLGGDPQVKKRIIAHAKKWTDYAGIELKFVTDNRSKPQIRISFDMNDGSWSYVGTDCLGIKSSEPTMNFGWLERDTADSEYSRTVLHEFGHAIGCIHEHSIPALKIPWNKAKVYAYYKQQGWTKEDVDLQVFDKYNKPLMNGAQVDKRSIMMYAIPKELTDGKYAVGWNTVLSPKDKKLISEFYPK
jgi:serralysin